MSVPSPLVQRTRAHMCMVPLKNVYNSGLLFAAVNKGRAGVALYAVQGAPSRASRECFLGKPLLHKCCFMTGRRQQKTCLSFYLRFAVVVVGVVGLPIFTGSRTQQPK